MQILFVGDVFGSPGRRIVAEHLDSLVQQHEVDLVVMNAENSAGGFGVTPAIADDLFNLGAHVLTTGNHVWDKKEIIEYMQSVPADSHERPRRLIRPANYAPAAPGYGFYEGSLPNGQSYAVVNLQGKVFMNTPEDPFRTIDARTETDHGKSHSGGFPRRGDLGEGRDGLVRRWTGDRAARHPHPHSHRRRTHPPQGTAYQTDVGMSGPYDSVIGVEKELVLARFLTGMPGKFEAARNDARMCATLIECDGGTGRAKAIQRFMLGE